MKYMDDPLKHRSSNFYMLPKYMKYLQKGQEFQQIVKNKILMIMTYLSLSYPILEKTSTVSPKLILNR